MKNILNSFRRMMKSGVNAVLIMGVSGLLSFDAIAGGARQWTNREGKSITGRFSSTDGAKVRIELENGTAFEVPVEQLSDADREYIDGRQDLPVVRKEASEGGFSADGVILERIARLREEAAATNKATDPRGWAIANGNLASVLNDARLAQEAAGILREILSIYESEFGRFSESTATVHNNLARSYTILEEFDDCKRHLLRAIEIIERVSGKDSPGLVSPLSQLGVHPATPFDEGEKILRKAQDIETAHRGEVDVQPGVVSHNLGHILIKCSKYEEAEISLNSALSESGSHFGEQSYEVAQTLKLLGVLYNILDRYMEGETVLRRAIGIVEMTHGRDSGVYAEFLNDLAVLLVNDSRYDEAEPIARQVILTLRQLAATEGDGEPRFPRDLPDKAVNCFVVALENLGYDQREVEKIFAELVGED